MVCRAGSPLSQEAAKLDFPVRSLPFLMEWDPISAMRLRIMARDVQNPVLHSHTGHAAALAAFASAGQAFPHIAHRRVDFPLNNSWSRRLKYDSSSAVVGVSSAIREILAKDGVAPSQIEVVPDGIPSNPEEGDWAGVEPDRFAPPTEARRLECRKALAAEFDIPLDAPWIGNLAALVPHKDHDNLIAAALLVLHKRPKAIFLIAGEGPEGPRLAGQIERMGLTDRVLLLGQRRDPTALLKALDIFALSSWGEGMGSVLLEAAACGVPIAATTAGGIPEIVEDGKSGLLAPPRDPEALAKNILRLLDEPALAQKLSAAARARLPDFGLRRMGRQMEAIYKKAAQ